MFVPVEARFGIQPIAYVNVPNTTLQSGQTPFANQEHPLGTIIRAYDPLYGEGEFIYLQSVASVVVGSWVSYTGAYSTGTPSGLTGATFQAALMATTANQDIPVAIAMAAFPAGSPTFALGWFQITGVAVAADNGTMTGFPNPVFTTGSGQVSSSVVAGKQVLNARALTADGTPSAGLFLCQIDRPFLQGQIT